MGHQHSSDMFLWNTAAKSFYTGDASKKVFFLYTILLFLFFFHYSQNVSLDRHKTGLHSSFVFQLKYSSDIRAQYLWLNSLDIYSFKLCFWLRTFWTVFLSIVSSALSSIFSSCIFKFLHRKWNYMSIIQTFQILSISFFYFVETFFFQLRIWHIPFLTELLLFSYFYFSGVYINK